MLYEDLIKEHYLHKRIFNPIVFFFFKNFNSCLPEELKQMDKYAVIFQRFPDNKQEDTKKKNVLN